MTTLVLPATLWAALRRATDADAEAAGVLFATVESSDDGERLLVRELREAGESDYNRRGPLEAELTAEFVANAAKRARETDAAIVYFHTHPFSDIPTFSETDDHGEVALASFLARRVPARPHCAMVLGKTGATARLVGTRNDVRIRIVGPTIEDVFPREPAHPDLDDTAHDRQIRAFGVAAQIRLRQLRVAIVGLGGTGSLAAEWLAHLGVAHFVLMDPDIVEMTNLNRVVGTDAADVGVPKVTVAKRTVNRINADATVNAYQESVNVQRSARRLTNVDAIFCCTDSHGSRAIINQLAYQFLIPAFDIGVAIVTAGSHVTHVVGRAQLLAPGLACLVCTSTLDPEQVRRDLLSDFERALDPYIVGNQVPQPAVISLNATVTSLAVSMFLGAFTRMPIVARHQFYDGMRGTVRAISTAPVENCIVCSTAGTLAQGSAWPLPGRTL